MTLFLNPVSYGIGTLAFVVGGLTLFFSSMLSRRSDWLERALFGGGFALSFACTIHVLVNGPYRFDRGLPALVGGAGTAFLVLAAAVFVARRWPGEHRAG